MNNINNNNTMSETEVTGNNYVWNANDYSNIITIGASALASVLLVLFKSRCTKISLCFGIFSCDRQPTEEEEENEEDNNNNNNNNNDNQNNNQNNNANNVLPNIQNILPNVNNNQNNNNDENIIPNNNP